MTVKRSLPAEYQTILDMLLAAEKSGFLPSAILLLGPHGTAKNILVDHICLKLLKKNDTHSIHPDQLELQKEKDASHIGIEQTRAFITSLSSSPLVGNRRIGIIRSADTLTVQSQNALLKTLEEPSKQSFLLLIADDKTKILPTITSRLVKIFIPVLPRQSYEAYILKEGIPAPDALRLKFCEGKIEQTIESSKLQNIYNYSFSLYQDIVKRKFSIFDYSQKSKKSDHIEPLDCLPYLIHLAEHDLLKQPSDSFLRQLLSTLLDYSKNPLNRNFSLILENVCIQN